MTVEQSSLQQNNSKRGREDKLIQTYATVKEITGIEDKRVIDEAINACRTNDGAYKVEDVVAMLIQDDSLRRQQQVRHSRNSKSVSFREEHGQADGQGQGQTVGQQAQKKLPVQETAPQRKNNVIDLTQDNGEQQDLHKAITASLQDNQGILGGQVTREEQDISRVLEASLAESKAGTKRKRGELWFVDPLNPHERKRQGSWPVGLKNIGNTCWFSAVIQSLFYIPKFRQMVLHFKCPDLSSAQLHERRNLRFMKELSLLFGFMVGSTRKYVDPSKAVDILKEAFSSPSGITDSQQDVSEFQHKLLEWLEDAFKSPASPSSPSSPCAAAEGGVGEGCTANPVTQLFYGHFKAEGEHEGEKFMKQETFGQFPLQVNGFKDIHESLEATTMQDEIEAVNKDSATHKSGQELWFTRLPPVLTFELCRFQFNQQLGRPEKIHNKLEFPSVIYVDRYLESNKATTRHRREQSRKLKDQLTAVQARLDRFMNYGSGVKRCPLHDILQYTLEFAESRTSSSPSSPPPSTTTTATTTTTISTTPCDVEMESPNSSLCARAKEVKTTSVTLSLQPSSGLSPSPGGPSLSSTSLTPQRPAVARQPQVEMSHQVCPAPKQVSDAELRVLQGCLRRWRQEVESDVRELQSTISSLETQLGKMYSDEAMQKFPYHLHAVLVHEGQAASGHYWAFIYDESRGRWLKFNDITVSESSWGELERESVGGYHNASAYCLMYVDRARVQHHAARYEVSAASSLNMSAVESLPQHLQEAVAGDNQSFAQELRDWDAEQSRKSHSDSDITLQNTPAAAGLSLTPHSSEMVNYHTQLSFCDTEKAVDTVDDLLKAGNVAGALEQAVESELKRLQGIAEQVPQNLPCEDLRLRNIMVYLMCNSASPHTQQWILLQQFASLTVLDHNLRRKQLGLLSREKMSHIKTSSEAEGAGKDPHQEWHERYHQFRQAVHMFVLGLQAYYKERYTEALPYFNHAWLHNCSMHRSQGIACMAGLDNRLIAFFRRNCLRHVNTEAMQQFEEEADMSEALTLMCHQILPSLPFLAQSGLDTDTAMLEHLRCTWCAFLEKELTDTKVEKLQEFLTKMFDNLSEVKLEPPQSVKFSDMADLCNQYTAVMNTAHSAGDIQQALT